MTVSVDSSPPRIDRLVDDVQAGHHPERAFRGIFRLYYPALIGFFLRRGFSREESHDLAQETFIGVHKGIDRYRGDVKFEHWLFQIAANVRRNELRHRSAAKRGGGNAPGTLYPDSTIPDPVTAWSASGDSSEPRNPLDQYLDAERLKLVRQAIRELPAQMRRCLLLRANTGMSYKEIADMLRISTTTVRTHLAEGRKRLRSKLGNSLSDLSFFDREDRREQGQDRREQTVHPPE